MDSVDLVALDFFVGAIAVVDVAVVGVENGHETKKFGGCHCTVYHVKVQAPNVLSRDSPEARAALLALCNIISK